MFTYRSQIHFDELDPMQMLHNSRFLAHVERATVAWYAKGGHKWELDPADNPDQYDVVREFRIEFLSPVIGTGFMDIEIWVERLGNTSCQYGFRCKNTHGVEYARGSRTIVKVDPATRRPVAWTGGFREHHAALLK
jgi:acyl-CoA thioester hydrolase